MYELKPFTPIARTNWREHNKLFGIKPNDRLHHTLCLGRTGCGKSRLIVNMALDDIYKREGCCVIDPLGQTVEDIVAALPKPLDKDIVYFDATKAGALPAFNPIYRVPEHQQQLVASEMVAVFKKLFLDAWGSKMEYHLRYCIHTLLLYQDGSLLDIPKLLTDKAFRASVLRDIRNIEVLDFWAHYDTYTATARENVTHPILNKVGVLLANDTLRGIFGQKQSIDFEQAFNGQKAILCNLSKGVIGDDVCTVLGSFLITAFQNIALRRATIPEHQRTRFHLFIDESHSLVSNALANMLPQVRKYGLSIFLASQQLELFETDIRQAILANVGTFLVFKVGMSDAKTMEKEFYPRFSYDDFMSLPRYHIYVKLMIDGMQSKGFSAVTLLSFETNVPPG